MKKVPLAIDIGSSNTRIYRQGEGIILSEPSVVALSTGRKREVKAVGVDAKKLIGKTGENTSIVCPISEGGIANERVAVEMLTAFLKKTDIGHAQEAIVSVPCGMSDVDLYKFSTVLKGAGVKTCSFIQDPVCVAVGMELAMSDYSPCFVVDMGGGVTNIAALSMDGIIAGISLSFGGRNIDSQLIDYVAYKHRMKIGLLTAERMKQQIGSLMENDRTASVINGRDVDVGRPRSVSLTSGDIYEAMTIYFDKVTDVVNMILAKLPAEVSAEIRHGGIKLCGGTAKTAGVEEYLSRKLEMTVTSAEHPELATIIGLGVISGDRELLKRIKSTF